MKGDSREKILTGALQVFASKGLSATRIVDIKNASGVSQGLLYHYFRSKEEIFTELIRTAFDKIVGACRWLEKQPLPPAKKIAMAVDGLLEGIEQNEDSARYHLLIAQATVSDAIPDEAREIIDTMNVEPYKIMARILRKGQKDGSVKKHNAKELALVFWTTINGLAIYKAVHGKKYKAPDTRIITGMFI
jgi:AcrR family transcriptional regulator